MGFPFLDCFVISITTVLIVKVCLEARKRKKEKIKIIDLGFRNGF